MRRFMMYRAADATGVTRPHPEGPKTRCRSAAETPDSFPRTSADDLRPARCSVIPAPPTLSRATGHVADGVEFDDGTVVVRWRTDTPGTAVYGSLEHARAVHGHGGGTSFVFHDTPGPTVWLCCMCFSRMDPPVNHCLQCGASGTAIPTDAVGLRLVQQHDEQRVAAINKQGEELRALREVALAVLGPTALGLVVQRSSTLEEGRVRLSVCVGATTYYTEAREGETEEAYLRRAGPGCALDPERVRTAFAARCRLVRCQRCCAFGFVGCQCEQDAPAGRSG